MSEAKELVLLPEEVQVLANQVPATKKDEVLTVLNQIFDGTAEWERQVDAIEVKGIDDKMSISLAEAARKNAKNARLNGEKIFDKKREEVQARMADDKLEDALWLKSKQIMQLKFKHIEEKAEQKSKYAEIAEAKRKADLKAARELELQPYAEFVSFGFIDLANMNDEAYANLLNGAKLQLQAKLDAEKKAEEERIAKEKAEAEERERMRVENERLKQEAEAKEKQLAEERAKAEADRKAIEEQNAKEKALAEAKAKKEREEAEAKLRAEREAKEKLEAELKAKQESEEKARKEAEAKLLAEQRAKEAEAKKAVAAPDKNKLIELANTIDALVCPALKSSEANKIAENAKLLLDKVSKFIRENAESI